MDFGESRVRIRPWWDHLRRPWTVVYDSGLVLGAAQSEVDRLVDDQLGEAAK